MVTRFARLAALAITTGVAEARGFEPPVPFKGDNSLAVSPIRPLWHASLDFLRVPDPLGDERSGRGPRNRRRHSVHSAQTYAVEVTARLRPELAELPAYVPGKTVPGAIKLASNETVFGPLPSVRAAIERAADAINRYPDNGCVELKAALAKHLNPAGSPGFATRAHRRRLRIGQPVPAARPDHRVGRRRGDLRLAQLRALPAAGPVAGATAVQVPLTDHTFDLDAMLAAVTERTRLIFVCNPNNPTSTVVDPDALTRFVEAVPSHILIAIDEAYVEYIRDGMLPDSLGLVRDHSNVVVLRTFSKAYGLAGLRVGYAVGHPDLITALDKVYVPFTVTQHLAGRGHRLAGRRRRAAGPHRRGGRRAQPGQRRRCAAPDSRCRRRRPISSGCRLGRAPGLRGAGRRRAHRGPAVRHRRCPGHHRCAGRKRRPAERFARRLDIEETQMSHEHVGAQEVHRVQGAQRRHFATPSSTTSGPAAHRRRSTACSASGRAASSSPATG